MTDSEPLALLMVLTVAAGPVAVLSNRLTGCVKVLSLAVVLLGAAITVQVIPVLRDPAAGNGVEW